MLIRVKTVRTPSLMNKAKSPSLPPIHQRITRFLQEAFSRPANLPGGRARACVHPMTTVLAG